jgi:hypothetical protein
MIATAIALLAVGTAVYLQWNAGMLGVRTVPRHLSGSPGLGLVLAQRACQVTIGTCKVTTGRSSPRNNASQHARQHRLLSLVQGQET